MAKSKNTFFTYVKVGLILLLICALTAGAVALIHSITKDTIEANDRLAREKAIMEIFGDDITTEEVKSDAEGAKIPKTVKTVFKVFDADKKFIGYCVNVAPNGFGGEINTMVGVDTEGKIKEISIVSMKETSGIGTKINTEGHLGQYVGLSGGLVLDKDVDKVSGASVSSKALHAGINDAVSALEQMKLIGGEGS